MSHPESPINAVGKQCRLVIIQDQLQPCPYLEGNTARMPLRLPLGEVTGETVDQWLSMGYRRSGDFVYRAECPQCDECQPTRVDVNKFVITKSMKRVLKRGETDLQHHIEPAKVDADRVRLFNAHRVVRNLGQNSDKVDSDSYRSFLVESCCDTREISLLHDGNLVGISVVDIGQTSISAVYTHFDPDYGRYSLGTYAILKQIQWAQQNDRRYIYLGMFVRDNHHLNYKARFLPQQRLIQGVWDDFGTDDPIPMDGFADA